MTLLRVFILVLAAALAVEAGIFYLLVGLGAGGDLIVEVEMIWLGLAALFGTGVIGRLFPDDDEGRKDSRPRIH